LTRCIGQKNHFSKVDWSKNTCFRTLVKMDMSISKKKPISQLELFEIPSFVVEKCDKSMIINTQTLFHFGPWHFLLIRSWCNHIISFGEKITLVGVEIIDSNNFLFRTCDT
jgi:hypothetical protein